MLLDPNSVVLFSEEGFSIAFVTSCLLSISFFLYLNVTKPS